MPNFELVVPAFNEAKNLPHLIQKTVTAATESGYSPHTFQLVVVQNGSLDNSQEVLSDLKNSHLENWFRIVQINKNTGYGNGIFQGLLTCTAPVVGWSHSDLQCNPKDVFTALALYVEAGNQKVVIKGKRTGRNWKAVLVSRVFEFCSRLILRTDLSEINAQPKVFPIQLITCLSNPPKTFAFDLYVLYQAKKNGYQIQSIPVFFPPRIHGLSSWAHSFISRFKTISGMIKYMWQLRQNEGTLSCK